MGDKRKRERIKLESTLGTGYFYVTTKNKKLKPDKIEIRRYDPVARKHCIFKEAKIKYLLGPTASNKPF